MSPSSQDFKHLSLPFKIRGRARLQGGGEQGTRTRENKQNRQTHSNQLERKFRNFSNHLIQKHQSRRNQNLPDIPEGAQFLLEIDPETDNLDFLCSAFGLEIVSEQEDGFVIVATQDLQLEKFFETLEKFSNSERGGASAAQIYELKEDETDRLKRILSDFLYQQWPAIQDNQTYTVEVGIECLGTSLLSKPRDKKENESEDDYNAYVEKWSSKNKPKYEDWDNLKIQREADIEKLINFYSGQILDMFDGQTSPFLELPDSFTVRIRISGKGLRDLVLNYPYVFEVIEPDYLSIEQPAGFEELPEIDGDNISPPLNNYSKVCVIDSGINEGHRLLAPAIHQEASHCFLPNVSPTDVADYVQEGGHGTRVAGAILYPRSIPTQGVYQLPCWIQNARILDQNNQLPSEIFPPLVLRSIIERYLKNYNTRIFNHSIAGYFPCRIKHMSAWAAEIDNLSYEYDVLIIQSGGNIPRYSQNNHRLGVSEHLDAGRPYPGYLLEPSCRIGNPAQSMNALTVGSIAMSSFSDGNLRSLGDMDHPSAFSATGPGIWNVIKPDVVEYAGTYVIDSGTPPRVLKHRETSPNLVRSTPPAYASDDVGTSYSTPKVSHIAAAIQNILPHEPALIYRALIAQSACWPDWANQLPRHKQHEVLKYIGYGIPSLEKATFNTPYRVTFISSGLSSIRAKEANIYEVSIPDSIRDIGEDFDIRVEITLSYSAQPRRTRRNKRGYLSVWLDWVTSHLGETPASFSNRVLYDGDSSETEHDSRLLWTIGNQSNQGQLEEFSRSSGTLQKDWAVIKSYQLTSGFCIGIRGHNGWDKNPESVANYSLAISFEAINRDVELYHELKIANEVEIQQEQEVEIEI